MAAGRRFKVLHIGKYYYPSVGGIETCLRLLCAGLKQHMDIKIVVANESNRCTLESLDEIEVLRLGTLFKIAGAPICLGMVEAIRRSEADIVHIHLPNPFAILAALLSGYKGKFVASYHSDIVRQKFLGKAFQPILMHFLDICSGVVVASPNYLASSSVLAAFQKKCHVIPYGIPTGDFQYYDEKKMENIRGQYGDRIIVTVGRLVYYKGIEYLIRAMREIDGRLLIIGDGPLRASLEREPIRNRVLDKVEFLGRIKDILPYYHAADVFALPSVSRSEAFGIVQLEAMACGKPVVNTNIASGVPFVSINELTGLTVPPSDSNALAKAINKLLWDSQLRTGFGRAARLRVQEEFSLDLMIKRTMNLYENIAVSGE